MADSGSTQIVTSSDVVSMQITTTKLNGSSYLLWAQAIKVALGDRKKFNYIESRPPPRIVKRMRIGFLKIILLS